MKRKSQIVLASAGLLLTGCATTQGSRTARASATQARATPAGPVTTSASAPSMIGAGTSLVVSTNEAISTAQDIAGKTYAAEVTNDIVDQRREHVGSQGLSCSTHSPSISYRGNGCHARPATRLAFHDREWKNVLGDLGDSGRRSQFCESRPETDRYGKASSRSSTGYGIG